MEIKLSAPDTRETPESVFEVLRDFSGGDRHLFNYIRGFMSENKKRVNR